MTLTLYQFPGACSRVTMNALEEIGLEYEDVCVNFRANEQKSSQYLALNPKGKVPALAVRGKVLTENAAILWMLHTSYPEAGLLPASTDAIANQICLSDLVWCSGTLHPMVRQVRMPGKWTTGETEGVKAHGIESLLTECERLSQRIGNSWWYGADWSIVDTYLYWGLSTARKSGFPLERFPVLLDHADRVRARPSFQRVLKREHAAVARAGIKDIEL